MPAEIRPAETPLRPAGWQPVLNSDKSGVAQQLRELLWFLRWTKQECGSGRFDLPDRKVRVVVSD